jgi:hypothetical protein
VKSVTESIAFQTEELTLDCPELENNQIFKLLRNRVRLFFFQQEDIRRKGMSKNQAAALQKSGIDFTFKV